MAIATPEDVAFPAERTATAPAPRLPEGAGTTTPPLEPDAGGRFRWREPVNLLAISFALMVFVVFNQQVITGRSLQPVHYEWFIANYCALIAIVLTAASWRRDGARLKRTNKQIAAIAMVALLWAFGEAWLAASVAWNARSSSLGKPTITSVVMLTAGTAARSAATCSRYSPLV